MEFTLHYRGPLKANGKPPHKHDLRRHFHGQLKRLWNQEPLRHFRDRLLTEGGEIGVARPASEASRVAVAPPPGGDDLNVLCKVDDFTFAPLVSTRVALVAELEITLLWRHKFGHLVTTGGDIDNRLKTLLDALRVPKTRDELPPDAIPGNGETPFYCLLEDDSLITRLAVSSRQLLEPGSDTAEVILIISVLTKQVRVMMGTIGLV